MEFQPGPQPQHFDENGNEKFSSRVEITTEKDWETCKKLREEAITGEDARMFNAGEELLEWERSRGEKEWKEDLSGKDIFCVLAWDNDQAIGMGRAKKLPADRGEDTWALFNAYTKPEFRGKHVGQKMFATRLQEMQKRGAKTAVTYIRTDNEKQLNLALKFGFEKSGENPVEVPDFQMMKLDLSTLKDFSHFLTEE